MIGASIKRKEDPRLITGQGKFTDDVHPRDAVYMAVLRSPHAHARILSVDTSLAKEHPGVVAVMTGAEVNARCLATFRLFGVRDGMNARSRWPMAGDVARYLGEPVAAVVASSLGDAWDATELIDVAYEALPAAVDMEQAMESGVPLGALRLQHKCGSPRVQRGRRCGQGFPRSPRRSQDAVWSSHGSSPTPWRDVP